MSTETRALVKAMRERPVALRALLILPAEDEPPVRARLATGSGPYWVWTIDSAGYVQAGRA